jgi:hypothetical protein
LGGLPGDVLHGIGNAPCLCEWRPGGGRDDSHSKIRDQEIHCRQIEQN